MLLQGFEAGGGVSSKCPKVHRGTCPARGKMSNEHRGDECRGVHSINHVKRHLITCHNIDEASSANCEIVRVLLLVFRDVFVHEKHQAEHSASIVQIMFQVRCKTCLKIVNIELARRVDEGEYSFLFGSAWRLAPTTGNMAAMATRAAGVDGEISKQEVMLLYVDTTSLKLALFPSQAQLGPLPEEASLPSLTCYSHIVDAMAHAPRPHKSNVFSMCAVQVQACHAQMIMRESFAQFARTNERYAVLSVAHVAAKLFLQIELRGAVDDLTNYQYGPFPTLYHETDYDNCRRRPYHA